MTDKQKEIVKWFQIAIDAFNIHEKYLLSRDLNERCIGSKFASYLEKALFLSPFRDYTVDVEYNRGMKGNEASAKMVNGHFANIDLIVHKRGCDAQTGFDNLICVEIKKSNDPRGFESDKDRLRIMTDNAYRFCYRIAFMLVAEIDVKPENCNLKIDETFLNPIDF